MKSPLLISLPHGLTVSGVSMWAVRLANGLAERGRGAALIVHPEPPGCRALELKLHRRVRVVRLTDVPPLESCEGDLRPYLHAYERAVGDLAESTSAPVIISPNLHGDCYGIAAALSQSDARSVRIVGWQHSDIEYDTRILCHYEVMIERFIAVSDAIEDALAARLGARDGDVVNIPYGVELPAHDTAITARHTRAAGPIRLLYAGRLEHKQKRILALAHMAEALESRGIPFTLTIAGDGPAAAELAAAMEGRRGVQLLGAVGPGRMAELLDAHDALVLPSRYEGLSVSMLEAMVRGCVPVLARTRSGALQVIAPGRNGELADVAPEADERAAGEALAGAVARLATRSSADLCEMSRAAQATIAKHYTLEHHLDRVEVMLDSVSRAPARRWPADRPCGFTAPPGTGRGSGSVPDDGALRLAALLESLAGRDVLIHGAGQHTRQLAPILAESPAVIVAIVDDDRQRQGERLHHWPIIAPAQAAATGATDVIISSWMHHEAIWQSRGIYESQGLRVHRLYA